MFAKGPGDLGSVPGLVIPKTQKMVLDASLFNTQHYKVQIKGKVEQSWERSSAPPDTLVLKLSKREPSGHPQLKGDNFTYLFYDKLSSTKIKVYSSKDIYVYACMSRLNIFSRDTSD